MSERRAGDSDAARDAASTTERRRAASRIVRLPDAPGTTPHVRPQTGTHADVIDCLLAIMTPDGWRPGIGDPTLMGWITVGGYGAAAMLCARRVRHAAVGEPFRGSGPNVLFWGALVAALLLLGVNKQLDLQSWLTWTVRRIAWEQGWYEHRRVMQAAFVVALALAMIAGLGLAAAKLRHASRRARTALLGAAFLTGFVITRAASFHHVDVLLRMDLAGTRINWLLELGGIALIAAAASGTLSARETHVPTPPREER